MTNDIKYMHRALELASLARGRTSPNPMVGCVVARNGKVLAEGYHERAGMPHAEAAALRKAGDVSRATVYVTLEPCCHHGKTPPCVDLLLERRPARVVAAMVDPNGLVSGKGIEALRSAGIPVEVGLLEGEARRLNEAYIKFVTTKRPFVIAKCAMSLDGKIATRTGDSKWISGEAARAWVHRLRNEVDAVLVGSRTVERDDPRLTTRLGDTTAKDPIRIVLDSSVGLPQDAAVFHSESTAATWLVTSTSRPNGADETIVLPHKSGKVDLDALMDELGRREIMSVLIEGGGETLASAFAAGIVDKVAFFVAPKIIGGTTAVSAVSGPGIERIADSVHLERMTATPIGDDILVEAYVKHREP